MADMNCAICLSNVDSESADILTMGAYGTPRFICTECADDLSVATDSHDFKKIEEAMDRLSAKLSRSNVDDHRTIEALTEIFDDSAKRAAAIKNGTYDFSMDGVAENDNILEDIPEELLETEEDRLLDEKEAKSMKKFDSIMNWVSMGAVIAAIAFAIFYFLIK
jgi:hypothetical protein